MSNFSDNKLLFNELKIMSALYKTTSHLVGFLYF